MTLAEVLETLDLHARSSVVNVEPKTVAEWAAVIRGALAKRVEHATDGVTPLEALELALLEAGITYMPSRLNVREYYEEMQNRLREHRERGGR